MSITHFTLCSNSCWLCSHRWPLRQHKTAAQVDKFGPQQAFLTPSSGPTGSDGRNICATEIIQQPGSNGIPVHCIPCENTLV